MTTINLDDVIMVGLCTPRTPTSTYYGYVQCVQDLKTNEATYLTKLEYEELIINLADFLLNYKEKSND